MKRLMIRVGESYFAAVQERGYNTFGVVKMTRSSSYWYTLKVMAGNRHYLPAEGEHNGFSFPPYDREAAPTLPEAMELADRLGKAAMSAYRDGLNQRLSTRGTNDTAACAVMDEPRQYVVVPVH